jgi:GAF domain-containing protein
MRHGEAVWTNDVASHPWFRATKFAGRERVKSSLAVPLRIGAESVGVLFVNYCKPHKFSENEVSNIELLANQAAAAVGALRQNQEKRESKLGILCEAGIEISGLLNEGEIIRLITKQVWRLAGKENSFASVRKIVDGRAELIASHPTQPGLDRSIIIAPGEADRIGVTGRAVATKQSQLVWDVRVDPDYIQYNPMTRTELTVPVMIDDKVEYTINLEHPELQAFDEEDRRLLESLALHTSIAVQNARSHEQVRAQNELLWLTLVGGIWAHGIRGDAITIKDEVREIWDDPDRKEMTERQRARLNKIERLAKKILSREITPPVPDKNRVPLISINEFLTERLRFWQENQAYQGVTFRLNTTTDDPLLVRITPEWLREICDQLADNASSAMEDSPRRELTIVTRRKNGQAEVRFSDTGPGIPQSLRDKILVTLIPKENDSRKAGVGLLLANAIAQNFGGKIRVGVTGETGTTMLIQLPLNN